MSPKQSFLVAGVDGCKGGWFVVITSVKAPNCPEANCNFELKSSFVAKAFAEVLSKTTDCKLICVDIPIGLSDGDKPRECDIAARKVLGKFRVGSIFPAPIRQCLSTDDYKTASEISYKYANKKLSQQSFNIMDKIRQVDDLMTPELQQRVREIHPEISFWALNEKKPMQYNKKKASGRIERMQLLTSIFPDIEEIVAQIRKPKKVAPDDILDALAAAWTASQIILQKTQTLPENPQLDSKDLRMEIVYPA